MDACSSCKELEVPAAFVLCLLRRNLPRSRIEEGPRPHMPASHAGTGPAVRGGAAKPDSRPNPRSGPSALRSLELRRRRSEVLLNCCLDIDMRIAITSCWRMEDAAR
jgi:hypothetical protein